MSDTDPAVSPDPGQGTVTNDQQLAAAGTGDDGQGEASPAGQDAAPPGTPDGGVSADETPADKNYRELREAYNRRDAEIAELRQQVQALKPTATPPTPPEDPKAIADRRYVERGSSVFEFLRNEIVGDRTDDTEVVQSATTYAAGLTGAIDTLVTTAIRQYLGDFEQEKLAPLRGVISAEIIPATVSREIQSIAGADADADAIIADIADQFGQPTGGMAAQLREIPLELRKRMILRSNAYVRQQKATAGETGTPPAQRPNGTLGAGATRRAATPTVNKAVFNEYQQMFPDLSDEKIMQRHGHAIERGIHP